MQRRTLCWPLQMVQYFSQVQRSSGKSHCAQLIGPCIRASLKTVPEHGRLGQGEGREATSIRLPLYWTLPYSLLPDTGSVSTCFNFLDLRTAEATRSLCS
jgi:hypothetical protein